MDLYFQRVSHAALHDVAIDWGGLDVEEVYPQRLPDLFVGRPLIVTGRLNNDVPATVQLSGLAGGETVAIDVAADVQRSEQHPALAAIWARMKIKDLATELAADGDPTGELAEIIRTTALTYIKARPGRPGILSAVHGAAVETARWRVPPRSL